MTILRKRILTEENFSLDDSGKLIHFTGAGGYPVIYLAQENTTLCPSCAQTARDSSDMYDHCKPRLAFVHLEGPAIECACCGDCIESAYGEPEEPK